jgi:hypothetical protein
MAATPLYKSLKSNGTTIYCFASSVEDISSSYMNSNYKMYFSKYALLNIPKQNLVAGSQSNPVYFDFSNSFKKSINAVDPASFNDAIVESLRNYVANQETVIRESRMNNSKYYYDTNSLETTTEKIFFKWCKKLGIIDFEPAIPEDEYFSNLNEFSRNNTQDDLYFPEYLWKEREVINWDTVNFSMIDINGLNNRLQIEFNGETNFKIGDTVRIYNVSDNADDTLVDTATEEGSQFKVLGIIPSDSTYGERVIFDVDVSNTYLTAEPTLETTGQAELVYNRLVQYIGEVNGVSNVQEANRSYTEVYAHIPDHTGMTPDILYRTMYDVNYKPNMTFPILPSQIQPEIMGAELFNSPIVNTPQNYPGSYFGQFDTFDFTYETSSGDVLRRSGDYYGITGDINNPVVDTTNLDGIGIDFNTNHYVKMNIVNRKVTNFDQFNALEINNNPPNDFEFNAILWYYTVEDSAGNSRTNLYGVSFLDNPNNNQIESEIGIKFPTYKKLVSNGNQDGTSYAFSLNLNFNIINENPQDSYNPEAINSMFSMNLFNKAMQRLASVNDSFLNILADQNMIKTDIMDMKGLLYTQTDLATINSKIKSLEDLLRLYSTNQLVSSETIKVSNISGSPPLIQLDNIDSNYVKVDNILVTNLYNSEGIIPINLSVPQNKNWLVYISNNDETPLEMPNGDNLTILLSRDLDYKQTVEFYITPTSTCTENKKLDIYINSDGVGTTTGITQVLLVGDVDLPVMYNTEKNLPNSASIWKEFNFDIDFDKSITLKSGPLVELALSGNPYIMNNSVKSGDTLCLNNFYLGTSSVYDFSGQYKIVSMMGGTSSYLTLDVSNNTSMVNYATTNSTSLPIQLHGSTFSLLSNTPYFTLNKGKKISITRISSTSTVLSEKYRLEILDL